jgi:flagellar biosynthesis regulator FlaF
MRTPDRTGYSQGRAIEPRTGLDESIPRLEDYLVKSTQELEAITGVANRGEIVDRNSRDWMLQQVDFIVETIGDESLELGDEMRSNLLQLLLAIANLNEQIRSQTSFDF